MVKQKTHRELDNDQRRGKKRLRERLAQTKEAELEIKEYKNEDIPDDSRVSRQHGFRPERS